MRTYARGTCLAYSPDLTNAFTVKSCLKGWRTSLNVPSMYQVLARARVFSCSCLANSRWRLSFTSRSARRKLSGRHSSTSSKSRSRGCFGRSFWRRRLACLARANGEVTHVADVHDVKLIELYSVALKLEWRSSIFLGLLYLWHRIRKVSVTNFTDLIG